MPNRFHWDGWTGTILKHQCFSAFESQAPFNGFVDGSIVKREKVWWNEERTDQKLIFSFLNILDGYTYGEDLNGAMTYSLITSFWIS